MAKSARFRKATVLANQDPQQPGKIRVRVGAVGRARAALDIWASLVSPAAGAGHGVWFPPEVGDEVLVAFAGGATDDAYVVGALWGNAGAALAPVSKTLRSRSGLTITLDETPGNESIRLDTPGGQHVSLHDGSGSLSLSDGNGNRIRLDPAGLTVEAAARLRINSGTVELGAGLVQVDTGMARFNGVVQCDTLIANSVISASYTPGQGNLQ